MLKKLILIKEQNTTLEAAEEQWGVQGCNHCLGLQLNKRENQQWSTEELSHPLHWGIYYKQREN